MNRRQQPQTPPTQQRPRQPQQQQQQPKQQQSKQQQQQQSQSYSPNQIPAQVSIPQAISILVSRINFLETKMVASSSIVEVPTAQLEEMTNRIVKLEFELLNAKDHIVKLQSFALASQQQPDFADLSEDV